MQRLVFVVIAHAIIGEGFLLDFHSTLNFTCSLQNLPCLDQNEWWGPYHLKEHHDKRIRPFKIEFDEEMIDDLRYRLTYHRPFIPPLEGISFQYGFNTRVLQDLVRYWADEYPFEERESFLNKYPMFKTNIQGLDIHFLWVKPKVSSRKDVAPVLLMHGWPGSVREFYEAIPLLTAVEKDRDFVLELVIPSLPGFGYSDSAVRPGLGASQAAVIMRNLMRRLGYKQFYVQGGDFGGLTGLYLATLYPKLFPVPGGVRFPYELAFHSTSNDKTDASVWSPIPPLVVDPKLSYRMYPLYDKIVYLLRETGYLHEHATKPDTIGVPLSDSPAGLMAYHLEKFNFGLGTRRTEFDLHRVPRDSLIDHVMLYWAPNAITTAYRYYSETFNRRHYGLGLDVIPCLVPTWIIQAENEATYDSPPLIKVKFPNLINATAIPFGGHFLAFETPETFSSDVLLAIGAFRKIHRQEHTPTSLKIHQENWSIDLEHFFHVLSNLLHHPEAWWIKGLVIFSIDALMRIVKRLFMHSDISSSVFKILSKEFY